MKKVITLVLYNRPDYTREVLDALRRCDGVEDYLILPHIEPGNEEVIALVRNINFAETKITVNRERLGIGRNTWLTWQHGFQKSDFIVHIEDDTVPAPDCLRYMEHCRREYKKQPEIFSVATYNRLPCAPERFYHIARRRPYTCWLVGLWRDRWEWIKNRWDPSPLRYATHVTNQVRQHELFEIYPLLSRSQNIGATRGFHVPSAEWHRQNHHTEHWAGNFDLKPGPYRESPSLVTAVMILGSRSANRSLAASAMKDFLKQSHPNKELLILNRGKTAIAHSDPRIRELLIHKGKRVTIGELRNLAIESAAGDYIIQWNVAARHHPRRIEVQMAERRDKFAVLLGRSARRDLKTNSLKTHSQTSGFLDTLLHSRHIPFRHPHIDGDSNPAFVRQFPRVEIIQNEPRLYTRPSPTSP